MGDAGVGDELGFAGGGRGGVGGGVSGGGQAVAADGGAGAGGGAAERGAVAEQVTQALGDDVHRGPLGGGDDGHGGGAAAGDQIPEQGDKQPLLLLGAQHRGEQSDLIDNGGDDGQAVTGFDRATAPRAALGV